MSLFKSDLAKESILGKFLSAQYLLAGLDAKRTSDRALQMKGVDLLIGDGHGLTYKVDEKAQLHYLNKALPTFALEIDYNKDCKQMPGWLFDPNKATEIYAFVFSIHLTDGRAELSEEGDIASCDVVFVNRNRLIGELSDLGLTAKICRENSCALRREGAPQKIAHPSGANFQVSNHLSERPVNLVVRRAFLEKIGKVFRFKNS